MEAIILNALRTSPIGDLTNIVVSKDSFTQTDTGVYKATVSADEITSDDVLDFNFNGKSQVVLTKWVSIDGGFELYASQVPTSDIVINRVSYRKENA